MPKEGISLYFTMRDGASQVLSAIGDKTKALDKETQSLAQSQLALQKANEPLIKRQTELKTALEKNQVAVKDARKEYRKLKDEASGNALRAAIEEQEEIKRSLQDVESQLKSNIKTSNEYREALRKSSAENNTPENSLMSTLGQAGVWSTLGDVAGDWATTLAGSALGSAGGSLFGSALGMAGQGAAIGTMIGGPGVGTAVGAALGGLVGAISGLTETFEEQDDAVKEYYGELADAVSQQTEEMIASGSTIAGSREQTQRAFAQRFGSDAAADEYLGRVQEMAARTNYGYDEITGYSKLLLNSYDPEEVFGVLQSLSDATAALALTSSDVEVMISGLSRMRTTGKATQEYLNYFSERGVDVYSALASATGADRSQIAEMVTGGDISGETAAQAILDYIDQQYGGLSEDLMSTYDAMADNLADIKATIEAAGGEGYNEARKEGLAAEADAYGGALGEAVSYISAIAGQNQAYLENLSEQYQREALSAVLMGEDVSGSGIWSEEELAELADLREQYQAAVEAYEAGSQEAGVKMESLYEQAQALGTVAYDNSDAVLSLNETEQEQIAAIRDSIVATNNLTGALSSYYLQQERSKGMGGGIVGNFLTGGIMDDTGVQEALASGDEEALARHGAAAGWAAILGRTPQPHAYGLDRVPYDNYPALLHEGERVLTASEARAQDREGGRQIVVNISGEWHVRDESDVQDIAEAIVTRLERAAVAAAPR